jgi:hypothetical protein
MEVQLHVFLISAMDGGELSASRPGHFIPWDKSLVPIKCEAEWDLVILLNPSAISRTSMSQPTWGTSKETHTGSLEDVEGET